MVRRALPHAGREEARREGAASKDPMKEKTARGAQAEGLKRTLDVDVFVRARCGGWRRMLAYCEEDERDARP
jgi:hypothetical protein